MAKAGLVLGALLFWGLRALYWSGTEEALFSDMADFYGIAERFAAGGGLGMDAFWQSYRAPVLPVLGAVKVVLFGDSMLAWRVLQAALLFACLCWLVRELRSATGSWLLPITLLFAVAVSQSSVFWSFKFAKEGLHEALLYGVLAAGLWLLRRPSWVAGGVTGALVMVAALNRSNFVLALAAIPGALLCCGDGPWRTRWRRSWPGLVAFVCGALLVWAPWGARTCRLYGHPILLTTDGAAVALDGLATIEVEEADGSRLEIRYWDFLRSAPQRFRDDAAADAWLGERVRRWILANPSRWFAAVAGNVRTSAYGREITLTKVRRDHLLPAWVDWLLVDKHRFTTWCGLLGFVALGLRQRRLWLFLLLTVPPWLLACCFLGLPRLFEPIVPLLTFGSVALLVVGACMVRRMRVGHSA